MSSQPRLLHILRAMVRWCARSTDLPEPEAESLAMAIDEAAANVIRHTYGGRPDGRLRLDVWPFSDRLEFALTDWGPKVCSEQIRHRPLDELRPGGLGTFFIKCFMDACSYDSDFPEGNRLRMVKYFSRKAAPSNERATPQDE
jgi:anti-sigma regulatory factor (Ser/Thr protein kinase)